MHLLQGIKLPLGQFCPNNCSNGQDSVKQQRWPVLGQPQDMALHQKIGWTSEKWSTLEES